MKLAMLVVILAMTFSCSYEKENKAGILREPFGKLESGEYINLFTLTNSNGIEMKVINYGGIITSLKIPDRNGEPGDVVLGYSNLDQYVEDSPYFGAIIGRYGNRIAKGMFTLDGVQYNLALNNGANHLHGGLTGFDKVVWTTEPIESDEGVGLKFSRASPDMEEGYPGNLKVVVIYFLGNDNSLRFDYEAETDKTTIVNLTQHTYFNFNEMKGDILDHVLMLNASHFVPVDSSLIPTGELRAVQYSPFDFNEPKAVGRHISEDHLQLKYGIGYDHTWVLNDSDGEIPFAGSLYDPVSGRFMEVYTTEPGIQFYSGNFLDGTNIGKNGIAYQHRMGLCLETQHFPDSPNQPDFPGVSLKAGETYKTSTVYKFSTR